MIGEVVLAGGEVHVLEPVNHGLEAPRQLAPGERVPSVRTLASELGLARGTVEAAYDLYATRFRVLRRVILPIIRPGIVAGSILVFVPSLGAYVTPRVLGGGKKMMIGNFIELQFGAGRNWPLGSALALILLLIVGIALIFYVRASASENKDG